MKMHFFITDLASALTFLTRLRLPGFLMAETPAGARAAWAYPLAGAIATIIPALVLAGFAWLAAPPLICALLAILVSIMVSGGLHEDGLADTADGFFGGHGREAVLAIMKDSHSGVYGVIAIVLSVLLRATALAALIVQSGALSSTLLYIAGAIAARGCLVLQWNILPPARKTGAAAAMGQPQTRTTAAALAITLALCIAIGMETRLLGDVVAALLCAFVATLLFSFFARRRIAGHTGDTLGATAQISESVFLLALVIAG